MTAEPSPRTTSEPSPRTAADLFAPLGVDRPTMDRLHGRLAARAAASGLLDVSFRVLDTPLGPLLLAATEVGLVRVAFAREDHDRVLADLAATVSPRILAAPARLDPVARQLAEYFDRRRTAFAVPVDLRLAHGFRLRVLRALPQIGYGRTASYAEVAAGAGSPRAARAVGSACATNPLPLVIPCHRVVRTGGAAGEYRGGPEAKRFLLDLERTR